MKEKKTTLELNSLFIVSMVDDDGEILKMI